MCAVDAQSVMALVGVLAGHPCAHRRSRSAYGDSGLAQVAALRWIHVGHVHHSQHTPATATQQAETVTGGSGTALDRCDGVPVCSGSGEDPASGCCYGKVSKHHDGEYSFLRIALDPPDARQPARRRLRSRSCIQRVGWGSVADGIAAWSDARDDDVDAQFFRRSLQRDGDLARCFGGRLCL